MNEPKENFELIRLIRTVAFFVLLFDYGAEPGDENSLPDCFFCRQSHGFSNVSIPSDNAPAVVFNEWEHKISV
jgi:hypothetical protein